MQRFLLRLQWLPPALRGRLSGRSTSASRMGSGKAGGWNFVGASSHAVCTRSRIGSRGSIGGTSGHSSRLDEVPWGIMIVMKCRGTFLAIEYCYGPCCLLRAALRRLAPMPFCATASAHIGRGVTSPPVVGDNHVDFPLFRLEDELIRVLRISAPIAHRTRHGGRRRTLSGSREVAAANRLHHSL